MRAQRKRRGSREFGQLCLGLLMLPFGGFLAGRCLTPQIGASYFPSLFYDLATGAAIAAAFVAAGVLARDRKFTPGVVLGLGFSLSVSGFYLILIVPLMPLCLLTAIALVGILALAPLWHFWIGIKLHQRLLGQWIAVGRSTDSYLAYLAAGILAFPIAMFVVEVRAAAVQDAIATAANREPSVDRAALDRVRALATRGELLRACYDGTDFQSWSPLPDPFGHQDTFRLSAAMRGAAHVPASAEACRKTFFRVFGRPFTAFRRPARRGRDDFWSDRRVSRTGSSDLDSTAPNGILSGLSLAASRLECVVDPRAAVGFVSWDMTFHNRVAFDDHEARLQIRTPRDATGSHLSLWVNGVEKKAAFARTGQARRAYEEIAIRQRKDPALLTRIGPGRYELRVFPVLARGRARVRIGFTTPMPVDSRHAYLKLPRITQRNFELSLDHAVRIVSQDGDEVARTLTSRELMQPAARTFRFSRDTTRPAYARTKSGLFVQNLARAPSLQRPQQIVIVVDGSRSAHEIQSHVDDLLGSWPVETPCRIVFAGAAVEQKQGRCGNPDVAHWLRTRVHAGAVDPTPALRAALEAPSDAAIFWLHGCQHYDLSTVPLGIEERRTVTTLAIDEGSNVVHEALADTLDVRVAPRLGDLGDDLKRLAQPTQFLRRRIRRLPPDSAAPVGAAAHPELARVWAAQRVASLVAEGDHTGATQLAVSYRLVTEVSAAVVLEREEQYEEHGLDPEAESSVEPTEIPNSPVPEPGTWLLLGFGAALLIRRSRRAA